MTRRRPYRSPDGVDWRDPDMPIYLDEDLRFADELHYYCESLYNEDGRPFFDESAPHYSRDPSYNWKRKP